MSSSISVPGLPETLATTTSVRVPSVKWAQRRDRLLLTIEAPQGVSPTLSLQEGTDNTLVYSCTASSEDSSSYALSLELFGSINASETRMQIQKSGAMLVVIAMKLTAGPHWPRLLKAPGKAPAHIKVDFDKFIDEDEEEELANAKDFDLGDMDNLSLYDDPYDKDIHTDSEDSDDEDVPGLDKA
mmetsp:Transcript_7078/g.18335  ORF Transcript_7078/g.18335 Transcript_7078/m.18335 type:complete len:185 (-) Transcript_7078:70-624(-)